MICSLFLFRQWDLDPNSNFFIMSRLPSNFIMQIILLTVSSSSTMSQLFPLPASLLTIEVQKQVVIVCVSSTRSGTPGHIQLSNQWWMTTLNNSHNCNPSTTCCTTNATYNCSVLLFGRRERRCAKIALGRARIHITPCHYLYSTNPIAYRHWFLKIAPNDLRECEHTSWRPRLITSAIKSSGMPCWNFKQRVAKVIVKTVEAHHRLAKSLSSRCILKTSYFQ